MAMIELRIPFELVTRLYTKSDLVFVDEVAEWVFTNIKSANPILHREQLSNDRVRIRLVVIFENENDALLFKMRWL